MTQTGRGVRTLLPAFATLVSLATFALAGAATTPSLDVATLIDQREAARSALSEGRWSAAADLYAELTGASPDDGVLWRLYALASLRSGAFDTAILACRRALETGQSPAETWYDMACAEALAGRGDEALSALASAFQAGFCDPHLVAEDDDLAALREAPRFREIVGWPDPAVTDRNERWTGDLRFLARRVREVHWRPFGVISEEEFDRRLQDVVSSIDDRSDLELRLDVQRLLAAIGDGHTAVVVDPFLLHHGAGGGDLRFLPIRVFEFDDGVRVAAATEEYRRLAGARVKSIGRQDVDAVIETLAPYISKDNEWGARWIGAEALVDPKLLEGVDLGSADSGFTFDLERLDGTMETVTFQIGGGEVFRALRDAAGLLGVDTGPAGREKDHPLYLESLEDGRTLYVRIDGVRDTPHESFAEFTDRIFRTAQTSGAESLILDLRDNPGGQGHLTRPLLHRLIGSETFNRRGHLFVLIGRKTFSAAMAFGGQVELHTEALFVGEPTGSRPNFVGESTLFPLPYSGLWVSLSSRYHQNGGSNDQRFWIAPDLPAPPSVAMFENGRDPALEAVLAFLAREGSPEH